MKSPNPSPHLYKTERDLVFTFCPYCATAMEVKFIKGRNRARCPQCGFIHYLNPTVGVAVVLVENQKILMGKRALKVSYGGMWCIPCGHVEWDEEIRTAAIREFKEETGLEVAITGIAAVHSNFHNPSQHTVGVWFYGKAIGGELRAGDDLLEVDFFPLDHSPEPLAFPTDRLVIEKLKKRMTARQPTCTHGTNLDNLMRIKK